GGGHLRAESEYSLPSGDADDRAALLGKPDGLIVFHRCVRGYAINVGRCGGWCCNDRGNSDALRRVVPDPFCDRVFFLARAEAAVSRRGSVWCDRVPGSSLVVRAQCVGVRGSARLLPRTVFGEG